MGSVAWSEKLWPKSMGDLSIISTMDKWENIG
jgi:hypothetical protein